jgi:Family of unknown function (DUF5677)
MDKIEENISKRSGIALPIEDRMIKSIKRLAESSGVSLDSKPINKRNWADRDLYQKAEAIGWGEVYLGIFGGMSTAVHGNWGDIAAHHLERFDGSGFYKPCLDWSVPRPQGPLSLVKIAASVCHEMFRYFGGEAAQDYFSEKLGDLVDRAELVTQIHEAFLAQRSDYSA